MKKCTLTFLMVIAAAGLIIKNAYPQTKLAQTGFQFLSVGLDARATAMADAFTTVEGSSAALFYNPAGMARIGNMFNISINQMDWIADIQYLSGSMALNFSEGRYGVFGVSFLAVDYGEFLWTSVANNEQGFEDIGDLLGSAKPSAYLIGVGYAKDLSDKFSIGGQVKYVKQDLGKSIVPVYAEGQQLTGTEVQDYALGVLAFDFGTLYKTGFRSLVFGMSVRNFSEEIKYEREGFQLPLTFKIGISMNAFDFIPGSPEGHSLFVSIDAAHPRSFSEYVNIGGEYVLMDALALRGGFVTNHDDYSATAGFGVRKFGVAIDYSYTPFDVFDSVNRFSISFSL